MRPLLSYTTANPTVAPENGGLLSEFRAPPIDEEEEEEEPCSAPPQIKKQPISRKPTCPYEGISGGVVYAEQFWHALRLTRAVDRAKTRAAKDRARSNLKAFFLGLGLSYDAFFGTNPRRST